MIDFLGIGAQKSGTTWLYENLERHPQVAFSAGKELHFWDREFAAGVSVEAWLQLFPPAPEGVRQGEITPAYAILDRAVICQVFEAAPAARLFYSMRNPMARAWSSALMALERAEMVIDEASDQWFLDHFSSAGSMMRGDYETCIANWSAVYPPGSLQLILFDDVISDPRGVLVSLAGHLRIDPQFFSSLPPEEVARPVFSGSQAPIRPSLRDALAELYRPKIERLADLLQRDLGHWLSWEGSR